MVSCFQFIVLTRNQKHRLSYGKFYNYNNLFIGWQEPWGDYKGIATWDTTYKQLQFINNDLPDAAINNFSTNDVIDLDCDCPNIICCTDSGAFFTINFEPSGIQNLKILNQPSDFTLYQNYPTTLTSFKWYQWGTFVTNYLREVIHVCA